MAGYVSWRFCHQCMQKCSPGKKQEDVARITWCTIDAWHGGVIVHFRMLLSWAQALMRSNGVWVNNRATCTWLYSMDYPLWMIRRVCDQST